MNKERRKNIQGIADQLEELKGSLEELLAAAGGCPGVIKCEIIGG